MSAVSGGGGDDPPCTLLEAVRSCSDVPYHLGERAGILPLVLRDGDLLAHIGWMERTSPGLAHLLAVFPESVASPQQEQHQDGEYAAVSSSVPAVADAGGADRVFRVQEARDAAAAADNDDDAAAAAAATVGGGGLRVSFRLVPRRTQCAVEERGSATKSPRHSTTDATGSSVQSADVCAGAAAVAVCMEFTLPLGSAVAHTAPTATVLGVAATAARTAGFRLVAESLRSAGLASGWRNELYVVRAYSVVRLRGAAPPAAGLAAVHDRDQDLHADLGAMERAATTVLGLAQFGVHANLYVDPAAPADQPNFWIAQRSATKATWPSCWDTAVAGGLAYRENIRRCMERECAEEAGVSEAVAARDLRATSAVSFCCRYAVDDTRGLFNDNDYVYDMVVSEAFDPTPEDGEVGKFELVSADELLRRITQPRQFPFLPSALLSCVDLLCRLGYVRPDREARDYFRILRALRVVPPLVDLGALVHLLS